MEIFKKPKTEEPEVFERTIPLYSIRDRQVGFTPPIPMENLEYARRYFKTQVLENPTMKDTPEDFSIWEVGKFETATGEVVPCHIELRAKGEEYVSN